MDAEAAEKEFYSPAEFAELSGFSLSTVHRRLADGSLPRLQLGGKRCRISIPRSALSPVIESACRAPMESNTTASSALRVKSGARPRWQKQNKHRNE